MTPDARRVAALVPAHDEESSIGATVEALRSLSIDEVVVVDDGSGDATAASALAAGATVLRIPRRVGKGGAMEGAIRRMPPADVWLLADADLGASAVGLGTILETVLEGHADLAIATFQPMDGGGFGTVKRASAATIRKLTSFDAAEPLSGQRVLTGDCLRAVRPLAGGFGVETAMTIDAVRAGMRVVEVLVPGLSHRATERTVRGFMHRGRQGFDVVRVAASRIARLR